MAQLNYAVREFGPRLNNSEGGERVMEKIEDSDIGPLWAEHYPKRNQSFASETVCLMLMHIVNNRARSIIPYGDWSDKLHHVLQLFGVPHHQFIEFENEPKRV